MKLFNIGGEKMMEINQIDFADASLEKIVIEYNKINIWLELDNKQKLEILCEDIVGVDNLCLWDENVLESIKVVMLIQKIH